MIESEQSDKKSLGIAEWNLLISKHERDNSWFCYKNKIWGMQICLQLMYLRNWINWIWHCKKKNCLNMKCGSIQNKSKSICKTSKWRQFLSFFFYYLLFLFIYYFYYFVISGKQKVLAKCLKVFLLRLRIICRIWKSQEDFRTSRKLNLLFYSITADIDATFKFVLIDIQSNHTMKEMLWLLQVFVY